MQYKEFKDIKLSRLGMGTMRLPVVNDVFEDIDYEKAQEIIDKAYESGINYYDTAYIYHGGQSEVFLGKAMAKYPRDSYYVADKFNIIFNPDYRAQFEEQLARLNMDRIDFYLLHAVGDELLDDFLNNGCIEYFEEMRRQGKITYFGFSFHGTPDALRKMVSAHKWDFVQIQLNYYDWMFESAREQYEILAEAGIPVMVMEPAHGGMLATLNEKTVEMLKMVAPERSVASWAMRWVMSLDSVQVVLSGMSNVEQMDDNVATFSEGKRLDEGECALVEEVAKLYKEEVAVPCTACRYCCDNCPMGLDIPKLLAIYNMAKINGPWRLGILDSFPEDKRPSACIGCGACTGHCPQSIDVPSLMKELCDMKNSL